MTSNTIGIKIANGEFYSIVGENLHEKKRLILTTVHDRQESAQIDLYRSSTRTMADAFYIGSLVLEGIEPLPKGQPSLELIISSSGTGEINASVVELGSSGRGEEQSLSVSLKTLDYEQPDQDQPDFDSDSNEPYATQLYERAVDKYLDDEKRRFPWLLVICGILVLAAIGLLLWFFVLRGDRPSISFNLFGRRNQTQQVVQAPAPAAPAAQPAAPAAPAPATPAPAAPPPAAPPPVIQAPPAPAAPATATPVRRQRPAPPVASYNVPAVIPREGVAYRVRWGDTLWDIAEAFCRNPWLYPRIAQFNNIRNPDLIISGTTIRVPPRN